jgi:hypothetical protein
MRGNNNNWHRSEHRDVRPFFAATKAEDAVLGTKIRLFDNQPPVDGPSCPVAETDFSRLNPVVLPSLLPLERWMPQEYTPAEFGLVVMATNPFLRRSVIVKKHPLSEATPAEVGLSPAMLEDLVGGRNLTITVALHLTTDREPSPGQPFVVGHWISKKEFSIRSASGSGFYDVRERKDEDWIAASYPAKTFYVVDYHGSICEPDARIATIYVHSDAYARLAADKLGLSIQKMLACEMIIQILQHSIKEWRTREQAEPRSPLCTILEKIDPQGAITIPQLKSLVEGSPNRLRALLQDDANLVRSFL